MTNQERSEMVIPHQSGLVFCSIAIVLVLIVASLVALLFGDQMN